MGFAKMWSKLQDPEFTTFRFTRKDTDWWVGEVVQVVYHSRSKDRKYLFNAKIIHKVPRQILEITEQEAVKDGFKDGRWEMNNWLAKTHGLRKGMMGTINKFTLRRCKEGEH